MTISSSYRSIFSFNYIPRNIMLELLEHEDIDDAKLKDAQNYLFPVEE